MSSMRIIRSVLSSATELYLISTKNPPAIKKIMAITRLFKKRYSASLAEDMQAIIPPMRKNKNKTIYKPVMSFTFNLIVSLPAIQPS